jgi:hypothetical protein
MMPAIFWRSRKLAPNRPRVYRGGLAAAVLLAPLLAATGHAATAAVEPAVDAGARVCGGHVSDSTYDAEVPLLGTAHACEHLEARAADPVGALGEHGHDASAADSPSQATESADPAIAGSWSVPFKPTTTAIGIASVLLHTGKVLLIGGVNSGSPNTSAYLFDPATLSGRDVRAPAPVYCGSVTQLSDGRVLSVGGVNGNPHGIADVFLFDTATETWVRQPGTPLGRYYPTSTRLPSGRVLIAAGTQSDGVTKNPKIELYTPPAPGAASGSIAVVGPDHATTFYPKQWVMPDGNLLQVTDNRAYRFDPALRTWTALGVVPESSTASGGLMVAGPPSGSNEVMVVGGLQGATTGLRAVQRYDYATNTWTRTADMPSARTHMNVVQVPDGTAFGIGGNSSGLSDAPQHATMSYDPQKDEWTTLASQAPRRAYHSTALLLPDGRIMSAGDNRTGGGRQLIDFYSPPYLFAGPRPTITSSPNQVGHGSRFSIGTATAAVTRAVLMAPGATTHGLDMNARHVELAVTPTGSGGFTATAPTARVAPRGYYMLFVLTATGVPSVAKWVHVGP